MLLIGEMYMALTVLFAVQAQAQSFDHPVTSKIISSISDSAKGRPIILGESPLVKKLELHKIPMLLGSDDADKDVFLVTGFKGLDSKISSPDKKKLGVPFFIWQSSIEIERQGRGDFVFFSQQNSPLDLKHFFDEQTTAILIHPGRNPEASKSKRSRTQLLSHYLHEAFHVAQFQRQALIKSDEVNAIQKIADPTGFCEDLKSRPEVMNLLYGQMEIVQELVILMEHQSTSESIKKKISEIAEIMRVLKKVSPSSYHFVRFWQYEEGSAEFVGAKAAMIYGGMSFSEMVNYQIGFTLDDSSMTGNDITYRAAALAGLIADALDVKIKWDYTRYTPDLTWWEMLEKAIKDSTVLGRTKDIKVLAKDFPRKLESEQKWLTTRYCDGPIR